MVMKVKCRLCGASIDKDISYQDKDRKGYYFCNYEHFIKYGNKIAKKSINPTLSQENKVKNDRSDLIDYLYLLYDKKIPAFVFKQIKDFVTKGDKPFTYKGIEFSLRYWVDTLENPFDKDTGIGIVEYIYDEAERFWKDKQRIARAAHNMTQDNVVQKSVYKSNVEVQKYKLRRRSKYV